MQKETTGGHFCTNLLSIFIIWKVKIKTSQHVYLSYQDKISSIDCIISINMHGVWWDSYLDKCHKTKEFLLTNYDGMMCNSKRIMWLICRSLFWVIWHSSQADEMLNKSLHILQEYLPLLRCASINK